MSYTYSQPLSKTRDSFVLWKSFLCFLQCDFQVRNCIWLRIKFPKRLLASLSRNDICREFKFGELGGHCFFGITCRQLRVTSHLATSLFHIFSMLLPWAYFCLLYKQDYVLKVSLHVWSDLVIYVARSRYQIW